MWPYLFVICVFIGGMNAGLAALYIFKGGFDRHVALGLLAAILSLLTGGVAIVTR